MLDEFHWHLFGQLHASSRLVCLELCWLTAMDEVLREFRKCDEACLGLIPKHVLASVLTELQSRAEDDNCFDVDMLLSSCNATSGGYVSYTDFLSQLFSETITEGYDACVYLDSPQSLDFSPLGKACTSIVGAENRGITLSQLHRLRDFLLGQANAAKWLPWIDLTPPQYSCTSGLRLNARTINLYQVDTWIIRPATQPYRCSLVELMCDEGTLSQQPSWFCSHWWGEPVLDFIHVVALHTKERSLTKSAAYWVCAYANNQHDLGADISVDPRQTSFYKAMELSDGVLLVLDPAATPFTRIWCCFEESMSVVDVDENGDRRLKLDFGTVHGGQPMLIAQGLEDLESSQGFPVELLEHGLRVDIAKGEASHAADKRRILNSIVGRPPSVLDTAEPPAEHPNFISVNRSLHDMFAEALKKSSAVR